MGDFSRIYMTDLWPAGRGALEILLQPEEEEEAAS